MIILFEVIEGGRSDFVAEYNRKASAEKNRAAIVSTYKVAPSGINENQGMPFVLFSYAIRFISLISLSRQVGQIPWLNCVSLCLLTYCST